MDTFEMACDEIDDEIRDYDYEQENIIEFIKGSDTATVTFTQGRYITKIMKLAERFPEDVQICDVNKGKNGEVKSIVAHIPVKAIKINIIDRKEMTEEEKDALRDRLAKVRESKNNSLSEN